MSREIKVYAQSVLPELDERNTRVVLSVTRKMLEQVEKSKGSDTFNQFVVDALNTVLFFEINPQQLSLLVDNDLKVNGKALPTDLERYKLSEENPLKRQTVTLPAWRKELAEHFAEVWGVDLTTYIRRAVEIRIEAYKMLIEEGVSSPDLVLGIPFSKGEREYLVIS